jgi:hypothetical protein
MTPTETMLKPFSMAPKANISVVKQRDGNNIEAVFHDRPEADWGAR